MEIHLGTFVWTIVNFLVLVVILNKLLYKPLLGMIEGRETDIKANLDKAEEAKNEAIKLKDEYVAQMQKARQEAQEIVQKATKLGEDTKSEIISDARAEAQRISEKATEEIKLERDKALSYLRDEVATLAVLAAGKVVEKNITPADQEKLVQDFIKGVGDVQ